MKLVGSIISAVALLLAVVSVRAVPRPVWIDTDLSLGSPLREVDDAYALLLALRSPELRVVGISTTAGNAPLRGTTARTRKSLGAFGAQIPVYPGEASLAPLAAALRREKLTYIALGPLTNLAAFLRAYPEDAAQIKQAILVAGRTPKAELGFGPNGKFHIHDANLVKDPAALRTVLRSPTPVLLAPTETGSRLTLDAEDLRILRSSGRAGEYLARRSGVWLWFWAHFVHNHGGPIFDALAVLAAARPDLVTTELRGADFDAAGHLIVRQNGGRRVQFCTGFAPATKEVLLRRLTNRPAKSSSASPAQ
jgi:pyrimidine-specific ribonucleoside hydrolase